MQHLTKKQNGTGRTGFEPVRDELTSFQGWRLNHSANVPYAEIGEKITTEKTTQLYLSFFQLMRWRQNEAESVCISSWCCWCCWCGGKRSTVFFSSFHFALWSSSLYSCCLLLLLFWYIVKQSTSNCGHAKKPSVFRPTPPRVGPHFLGTTTLLWCLSHKNNTIIGDFSSAAQAWSWRRCHHIIIFY